MSKVVSVSVSDDFFNMAKNNNISWSEAMRIGLSIMFKENGIIRFDNQINHEREIQLIDEEIKRREIELEKEKLKLILLNNKLKREKEKEDANKENKTTLSMQVL